MVGTSRKLECRPHTDENAESDQQSTARDLRCTKQIARARGRSPAAHQTRCTPALTAFQYDRQTAGDSLFRLTTFYTSARLYVLSVCLFASPSVSVTACVADAMRLL